MNRRKTTRGVSMFVRIKEENLKFIKKKAEGNEISLSFYVDKLIDSMRKKDARSSK